MMTRSRHRCALLAVLLLSISQTADAGLKILEGEHTVVYDIVNPRGVAFIPEYANDSFEQRVVTLDEYSKRVQVTARMRPVRSRMPYPLAPGAVPSSVAQYLLPEKERQSVDPAIQRAVREITADSRSLPEASHAILSWIADNLVFDSSITAATDAVSVFRTKKAYCVGYSNLAVAMLRAAGIPARVAHGYLPPGYEWGFSKDYWGVKVNDGGYHAYIELFYPDAGWVFSDAEHSHNFVDPYHILLRLDGMEMPGASKGGYLDVDKATFYTIYKETDTTVMVDELSIPRNQRLGRRIDDRQHSALVSGRVVDSSGAPVQKGTVVLWKDGKGSPAAFTNGRYAAPLSGSGTYRVELRGPGYRKSTEEIKVEQGRIYQVNVTLQPGGGIRGTVTDQAGKPVRDGDVFYQEGNTSFGVPLDANGSYRIEGLAPGRYRISVVVGEKELSATAEAVQGKDTVLNFLWK